MTHQEPSDEILEQAALYALGALEGQEKDEFERRVSEGCATCQAVKDFQVVAGVLGTSARPMAPPPSLRDTLLERVAAQREAEPKPQVATSDSAEQSEDPGFIFVRAAEDEWRDVGPGVRVKLLSFDKAQQRMTALARMAPGSGYAPHTHTAPEEFYVLEGTCRMGGQMLGIGDYHRAEIGTTHHETYSEEGCLMLTIFSPSHEMLELIS